MKTYISNKFKSPVYKTVMLILSVLFFAGMNNLSARSLEKILEKSFKVNKGELLKVEVDVGELNIKSWEKDEFYVKISGNDNAKEDIELSVEKTSYGVFIKGEKEDGLWSRSKKYKLLVEINIPRDFNTDLRTAGGNIELVDIDGKNEMKTSGGNILIKYVTGEIDAHTSGGNITLSNILGNSTIYTSGGEIDVKSFKGDLDARTSGGDLNLEVEDGRVDASTSGGNVRFSYKGINKGVELSTSGGNIDARIPHGFQANAILKTSGGRVSCDVSSTKSVKVTKSKFEGEINGGGPMLECRTSGGNIELVEK